MATVEQVIKEHINREHMEGRPDLELDDDVDLIDESIVDSLGMFTLIAFVEERFAVEIAPEEVTFENFRTIRSVGELVRAKQALTSA